MNRWIIFICVCLSMAACTPAPSLPATGGPAPLPTAYVLVPVEAQRLIDHATATAQAVATENAYATATRVSALEVADENRTATAAAFSGTLQAATLVALQVTQDAERSRAQLEAAAAQANATHTQMAQLVQATEMVRREAFATQMSAVAAAALPIGAFVVLALSAAAGVLLVYLGWEGVRALVKRLKGRAAYIDTKIGPACVEELTGGRVRLTLLNPPSGTAAALTKPQPALREFAIASGTADARVLRERVRDTAETARLRSEIADLLRRAAAQNGNESHIIPRHDGLGMGAEKRQRLVGVLKGAGLAWCDNTGTYLAKNRTLYELLCEVTDCRVSLNAVEVVGVNTTPTA